MDAKRHLVATLCTKLIFCFFFILQWITNLTNYNSALHNYYIYNQFNKVMWPRVTWPETSYNYSMLHITKMDFSTKIMSWSLATTAVCTSSCSVLSTKRKTNFAQECHAIIFCYYSEFFNNCSNMNAKWTEMFSSNFRIYFA